MADRGSARRIGPPSRSVRIKRRYADHHDHPVTNPPATGPTSGAVTVSSARVGSLGAILVNQSGLTLYRYSPDGKGKTTCTGTCAMDWPPLTLPAGTTTPTGSAGVSTAALGTITRPGGARQVTFDGMPLYRFSGDSGPGQAHGQGVGGVWFVLSPSTSYRRHAVDHAPSRRPPPPPGPRRWLWLLMASARPTDSAVGEQPMA